MGISFFQGRSIVIATMHRKEAVIAPILKERLGLNPFVINNLNTDELGTFTGEVERKGDPLSTARHKCMMAMDITGLDMAIASEGSFGAHPEVFFAKADDEIILMLDKKNNLEFTGRVLSLETNFDGTSIDSWIKLRQFAENAKFPGHGLILRRKEGSSEIFEKGIRSWARLEELCNSYLEKYGEIWVETDMRAMHNPTRMKVIEEATRQLVSNVLSCCPNCGAPGFVVVESIPGLPCSLCHQPTRSIRSLRYLCKSCGHEKLAPRQDNKYEEDPMYCDFCNP